MLDRNVLLAGTGCLDHLIDRAISPGQEFAAKTKSDVTGDFCFLKGKQLLVGAVPGIKPRSCIGGLLRRIRRMGQVR
jgi:hypothetical protein